MPRFRHILAALALLTTTLLIGCQSDDDPADATSISHRSNTPERPDNPIAIYPQGRTYVADLRQRELLIYTPVNG